MPTRRPKAADGSREPAIDRPIAAIRADLSPPYGRSVVHGVVVDGLVQSLIEGWSVRIQSTTPTLHPAPRDARYAASPLPLFVIPSAVDRCDRPRIRQVYMRRVYVTSRRWCRRSSSNDKAHPPPPPPSSYNFVCFNWFCAYHADDRAK